MSASADFVLFVSQGNFAFQNPANRPAMFELGLRAPVQRFELLSAGLGMAESVRAVSLTSDERVTTYLVDGDGGEPDPGDNRMVVRTQGSEIPVGDDPAAAPAGEPLDVELLSCSVFGPEAVATVRLRQWRGGERNVILTLDVVDEGGDPALASHSVPVIQSLLNEHVVEVEVSAAFSGANPTCRIRAVDAETSHPDVIIGEWP